MNKKGLELAINTIIVLLLSIFLLIALVLFFTDSFSDFKGNIKGFSGTTNVDNVVKSCNVLVDTNSQYSYCCERKNVRYFENGEKVQGEFSCYELSGESFGKEVRLLSCGGVGC